MKKPSVDLTFCVVVFTLLAFIARAFGQSNDIAGVAPPALSLDQAGALTAMYKQIVLNPSSLVVLLALCILGWLADDVKWFDSRYICHVLVVVGSLTYRFFCLESVVPKYFPHPQAIFMVDGMVCGFTAFFIYRYAVAKVLYMVFNIPLGSMQPKKQV